MRFRTAAGQLRFSCIALLLHVIIIVDYTRSIRKLHAQIKQGFLELGCLPFTTCITVHARTRGSSNCSLLERHVIPIPRGTIIPPDIAGKEGKKKGGKEKKKTRAHPTISIEPDKLFNLGNSMRIVMTHCRYFQPFA